MDGQTNIIAYDGTIKKIQNIKIGDLLMGDDSKPRRVLNISEGESVMYKVKQTKGEDYIVNENHVLSLKVVKTNRVGNKLHILGKAYEQGDFIDIAIKDYLSLSKTNRKANLKGLKTKIEFLEQNLPIEPYLIGLWLGDGNSGSPAITNQDSTIIKYLTTNLCQYKCYLKYEDGIRKHNHYRYKIKSVDKSKSQLKRVL